MSYTKSKHFIKSKLSEESSLSSAQSDFESDDDFFIITVEPENFEKLIVVLESKDYDIDSSEISLVPENTVKISSSDSDDLLKLLELLEEYDDVQKVYSNFELVA